MLAVELVVVAASASSSSSSGRRSWGEERRKEAVRDISLYFESSSVTRTTLFIILYDQDREDDE